jgi:transposase
MGHCVDQHGFDAGKKIKGKKRHILVDTQGLLMHAIVHGTDIQDRDGGALLMATLFGAFPFLLKLYADGGYQGAEFQAAVKRAMTQVNVEIVKRSDCAKGFVVLPKRWLLERTFACLTAVADWRETGNVSAERPSHSCNSGRIVSSSKQFAATLCQIKLSSWRWQVSLAPSTLVSARSGLSRTATPAVI